MTSSTARFGALCAVTLSVATFTTTVRAQQTPPPPVAPKNGVTSPLPKQNSAPTGGAARPAPRPVPPKVTLPGNVAARVNGHDITRDEALAYFDMVNGRPIVGYLIQARALEDEAKKQGVVVSDEELRKGVQDAKDRVVQAQMQQGQPMTFAEIAKRDGFSEDLVRYSVYLDILKRKTFKTSMTKQIPSLNDQVKLAHILIATIPLGGPNQEVAPTSPADQTKKDAEAKTKIEGILADIKAKKLTFDQAAKQYSDDKSNADQGGALPFVGHGTLDPAFEQAGFAMKTPGEVVGPVKSQFGWHLIKLISRGQDATAAEKAQYHKDMMDRIEKQSTDQQTMQSWFNSVLERSNVVVNPQVRLVPTAKSPAHVIGAAVAKKTASR